MPQDGWVTLHRKIMESDTFSRLTAIQKLVAIYIVLNANHARGIWYDKYKDIEVPVERGELITSRNKIANEWFAGDKEVTEQKTRTTLKKLEKLGFLTIESTKHYTKLKVLNYSFYQDVKKDTNQQTNQEPTKHQPSTNQASTTNNNDNNDNNDNKNLYNNSSNVVPFSSENNPFEKYHECYGKFPTPKITDDIQQFEQAGMEQRMICLAIEKAAGNGSGFQYALGILNNWKDKGLYTYEQAVNERKRREESKHGEHRESQDSGSQWIDTSLRNEL